MYYLLKTDFESGCWGTDVLYNFAEVKAAMILKAYRYFSLTVLAYVFFWSRHRQALH